MQQLLKNILLENINNDRIYNISEFLKDYNQPKSNFNLSDFNELHLFLMHKYHNHKNLGSLYSDLKISKLLHTISAGLSLKEFESKIEELTLIPTKRGINLGQLVTNSFNSKILDLSGWLKIYFDKIKGSSVNKPTYRIYLAVDNSCLHRFALLFIKQCELNHVHYQFKINNGNGENKYDNVVMYAAANELPLYIHCIANVLDKHPEIKLDQQCPIAYPFDKNIAVAPYLDTETESYSQIVSNAIGYYRENAESRDEFISNVEEYFARILKTTEILCTEIRNANFGCYNYPIEIETPKRK